MRLNFKKQTDRRVKARKKNHVRIRKKVIGSEERPRLCVFRSCKYIYAQLVDDAKGVTVASASGSKSKEAAKQVGMEIAKIAQEKNIKNVVFDRSGYIYHGKIKSLADGAREGGLNF